MSEGRSVSLATLTAVVVIALDQASKALVRDGLPHGEERDLAFGAHLVHVENNGVAFGRSRRQRRARRARRRRRAGRADRLLRAPSAHAADLAADRAPARRRPGQHPGPDGDGAVTDFVKLPHWPAFNVADIAVTVGVVLLLVVIELQARREKASAEPADPQGAEGDGAAGRA